MKKHRAAFLTLALLSAQGDVPPRYLPAHFRCAVFHESLSGEARGQAGRATREELLGRDGILVVRKAPADSGGLIEAWFDSLRVWRSAPGGMVEPDVEGLLGGQWVGSIAPNGRWSDVRAPFVPDDVAAVMDLRRLLDDFFPLLPARALANGAADTSDGRVIRRERIAGGLERFTWRLSARRDTSAALGDSLSPVREELDEEGTMVWSVSEGPIRWERTVTTTLRPLAKELSRSRGTVSQRISVVRLRAHPACLSR